MCGCACVWVRVCSLLFVRRQGGHISAEMSAEMAKGGQASLWYCGVAPWPNAYPPTRATTAFVEPRLCVVCGFPGDLDARLSSYNFLFVDVTLTVGFLW